MDAWSDLSYELKAEVFHKQKRTRRLDLNVGMETFVWALCEHLAVYRDPYEAIILQLKMISCVQ